MKDYYDLPRHGSTWTSGVPLESARVVTGHGMDGISSQGGSGAVLMRKWSRADVTLDCGTFKSTLCFIECNKILRYTYGI